MQILQPEVLIVQCQIRHCSAGPAFQQRPLRGAFFWIPRDVYLFQLERQVATNLRVGNSGRSHLASVSFSIGIDNTRGDSEEIITLMTEKEAMVRDICLSTMRSMTYEELNRDDGMDVLREEILNRMRDEFRSNLIVSVTISDWYLEP